MDYETLKIYIKQHIDAQEGNEVVFAWQGGEPTLLGISFYKKAFEYCTKYAKGKTISHTFQTNGILIDENWCSLFKENGVLVGISIDGPKHLHDIYRKTVHGKGTFNSVTRAIELLKEYEVSFNTLSVINNTNVKEPILVYDFLKNIGSKHIQFIPLVERTHSFPYELTKGSVPAKEYGIFLLEVFMEWVKNDLGEINVQIFDSLFSTWLTGNASLCTFSRTCGHAFALESNGDLYQCDHYVFPQYKLGNIHNLTIQTMNSSKQAVEFGLAKNMSLSTECQICRFKYACNGGCPKNRFSRSSSGESNKNYLCEGYFHFFEYTEPYVKIVLELLNRGASPHMIKEYIKNAANK